VETVFTLATASLVAANSVRDLVDE